MPTTKELDVKTRDAFRAWEETRDNARRLAAEISGGYVVPTELAGKERRVAEARLEAEWCYREYERLARQHSEAQNSRLQMWLAIVAVVGVLAAVVQAVAAMRC